MRIREAIRHHDKAAIRLAYLCSNDGFKVSIVSLGSSAPSRRVLLAHRHDRVRAAAEMAFQATLLQVAQDTTADFR